VITRVCKCYHPDWMHNYYREDFVLDCGFCRCPKFEMDNLKSLEYSDANRKDMPV
jgi:hypothetical protein